MKICVVGAGKMGLPLAVQFARKGAQVTACDIREDIVAQINAGDCPLDEPGVPELLREVVAAGRLVATTDTTLAASQADAVVVIVPALLTEDRHADLSILETVTRLIAAGAQDGLLVSYETTVPVGTTRNRFARILAASGKIVHVAFSPERVKSMCVMRQLEVTPKVVGGVTPDATRLAAAMYRSYLGAPVEELPSAESAEFVKLAGMLYRDVNIALSNELARYAEFSGIDLPALIPSINTDGEAALLHPGIGVGGHCTPVYPYFLIHDARDRDLSLSLAESARQINDGQAAHVVERLLMSFGPIAGLRVLILGLGFRPQIKEHLFSPAFLLRDAFVHEECSVRLADPLYTDDEIRAHGFEPGTLEDVPAPDIVVLNTVHNAFARLDFAALAGREVRVFVDGRNHYSPVAIAQAGLLYLGIGR